jgi:hypothetical protein
MLKSNAATQNVFATNIQRGIVESESDSPPCSELSDLAEKAAKMRVEGGFS